MLYGEVVSAVPTFAPSTLNWTEEIVAGEVAEALAERVTDGPVRTAEADGVVTDTVGAELWEYTYAPISQPGPLSVWSRVFTPLGQTEFGFNPSLYVEPRLKPVSIAGEVERSEKSEPAVVNFGSVVVEFASWLEVVL